MSVRLQLRAVVAAAVLAMLGGGALAVASPGADVVQAHGALPGEHLDISAVVTPSGGIRGEIRDFRGLSDVYCVGFRVAEGIFFVPDGSQMARVGARIRSPIDIAQQTAYILIKTPTGANFVWGPFGFGSSGNACDLAGWSDSVPPTPFDGRLMIRN